MKLIYGVKDKPKFGQITITSIACALILGILVNFLVNKARKNKEK